MQTTLMESAAQTETYTPTAGDMLLVDTTYLPKYAQITMTPTQFAMALFKTLHAIHAVEHPQSEMVQVAFQLSCLWANQWIEENETFPPHPQSFLNWGLPNSLNPPYVFVPGFDTDHTIALLHVPLPELLQRGHVCLVCNNHKDIAVAVGTTEDREGIVIVKVPQASAQSTLTSHVIPQPRLERWDAADGITVLGALHVNPQLSSFYAHA